MMRTTVTVDGEMLNEVMRSVKARSKAHVVRMALDEMLYQVRVRRLESMCGPWFKWDDRVLEWRHLGHRAAAIEAYEAKRRAKKAS